jgi:V/A-type H+-transporting ATPase subunit F
MKKIVFITTRDAEYGFNLAGITQRAVDAAETGEELDRVMAEPDNGLIIIDERLVKGDIDEHLREREQSWNGILLVLPSPEILPAEAEDYAARLIRRAIGYHVRLNV